MIDRKQLAIKNRILAYAMELWGVTDAHQMDPVIDRFLDVLAYESNKLHQELELSDSRILHRLSRILVGAKWTLPLPAHALMTIPPHRGECYELNIEDHFYAEKPVFGKENMQVFFTPLFSSRLIDARIRSIIYHDSLSHALDNFITPKKIFSSKNRVNDYSVWVGIDLSAELLNSLDSITMCVIPSDLSMLPFLNMVSFYDCNGNRLSIQHGLNVEDSQKNAHYFNEIRDIYTDYYFTVYLSDECKERKSYKQVFPLAQFPVDDIDGTDCLFWLRIGFPEVFTHKKLEDLQIRLNTFPVVNRQLVYRQHHFPSTGRIIPLSCPDSTHFLNVHTLQDDKGREYIHRLQQYEEKPTGVFSLYFGELERFDSSDASSLISKLLQLIKEDGNAFAAMNPDILSKQLTDLFAKLTEIEKSLKTTLRENTKVDAFILSVPETDASHAELKYWVTSASLANGFDARTQIQQFNMEKYDSNGIALCTRTQGGMTRDSEQALTRSLRYGLLSRERIVSKEDVKNYILHKMGSSIRSIEICNGVAISPNKKKGLVRTTEIRITLNDTIHTAHLPNLPELAHYLEKDLADRAVCNSTYKIIFS